jgi:heat shock protein HslJ
MNRISVYFVFLLVVAAMAAGCTTPQTPAPVATPVPTTDTTPVPVAPPVPESLVGHWTLTTMGIQDGTAVIHPDYGITLTLNPDGSLTGYTGCNNYFGSFTLTGAVTPKGAGMAISDIGMTKMYCAPYAEQEQDYLAILKKTAAFDASATELTLTADTMDVLVYQRTETLPTPA